MPFLPCVQCLEQNGNDSGLLVEAGQFSDVPVILLFEKAVVAMSAVVSVFFTTFGPCLKTRRAAAPKII